uniref:Peptidase S1 domain-containing protein n=1 Tax=Panagrellus redivivus TaxID=6233 RepID=A0A7E4W8P1_PANRE
MMHNFHLFLAAATCAISVCAYYDSESVDSLYNDNEFKPRMVLEGIIPTEHSLPFVAYIAVTEGKLVKECTGSIIAPRYVLTAFHCLLTNKNKATVPQAIAVRVGSQYKSKGRKYLVSGFGTTDKTAQGSRNWDDIVILELTQEILFDFLTTAAISLSRGTPRIGETLTIAGHGTRIVQRRFLKSDSYVIGNVTVRKSSRYCKPKGNEFCAGGLEQGTAMDDSGGPAFKIINRKYVQVGMILGGEHFHKVDKSKRDFEPFDMYGYGNYLKIAPYCEYIQRSTAGTAYCQ